MTPVQAGLLVQVALALTAVVAATATGPGLRSRVAGSAVVATGLAGAGTGALALGGGRGSLTLALALPVDPVVLAPDRLGGFFMVVAGLVSAVSAAYGIGYARGPAASRTAWSALAVFLLALQLVPAAADAISFLLLWELMAVTSTVLLLAEHARRTAVRSAAVWYAVMTHLSFVLLLLGFAVLAAAGHGTGFAAMATVAPGSVAASLAFALLVLGFASKAGIVPLHVWLPRAHPEAPSHVSALMSAAMVKMGVYGLLLVTLRLLPGGPAWWGLLLAALGAVSAVYGILQASVATDLKRMLAYSTSENVGLMVLALGAGLLLRADGNAGPADAAVAACLLLVASHAAFKTTLFLGAGSVLHATGERDLDRMGGLAARLPTTSIAFGIGALGAAALPVTSGFVAEWALLQSLIHGATAQDRLVAVVMPVSVAVVALTAGLALLAFVKAYGIAFLARPRSEGAAGAREGALGMRFAMVVAASGVVALGLAPGPAYAAVAAAAGLPASPSAGGWGLDLTAVGALLHPAALTVLAVAVVVPVLAVSVRAARSRPRRRVELPWGCGGVRLSPRMQYTATSYAEPLSRVFDDALRPERDVVVTHSAESRYLVERVRFAQHVDDVVEVAAYRPGIRLVDRVGLSARRLQNGSIHRYLGYSFVALVAVLVAVSL
ncbi:MAG TPA: proton-conducting transporter membrane subunit [Candidatus Angelobacter sp.]|nr:proton-conducting transporter membrane subunit [Candidatus Angelobacter sp.]